MNKSNALDWMLTSIWFLLILLFIDAYLWFGSTSYFVISGIVMLVGIVGMLLTLSCHDGVKSPRFPYRPSSSWAGRCLHCCRLYSKQP